MVEFLSRCGEVLTWLGSPSVIPWAGAVAAIAAALTVETKTWLKSPWKGVGRALWVATVWLAVAWMLTTAATLGSGQGSGKGQEDGSGIDTPNGSTPAGPTVIVVPDPFPTGTPEHIDLVIRFVPTAGDQSVAQYFSCDLLRRGAEENSTKVEIRATNMPEFDKLLIKQLQDMNFPQTPEQPTVLIQRFPFPGEPALRRVNNKVRAVLPNATVVFDE